MKKLFCALLMMSLACGSSDDSSEAPDDDSFTFTITPNTTNLGINERLDLLIESEEPIKSVQLSTDNFGTSSGTLFFDNNVTAHTLYIDFDILGSRSIDIKVENFDDQESIKTYTTNVIRGDAVKINNIEVVSFSNIGGTWDSEFSDTDIERLADVFVFIRKPRVQINDGTLNVVNWFKSITKQNQGDLSWDVSAEDLYVGLDYRLYVSLADEDDNDTVEDIMLGPPYERFVRFSDYLATQPNTVTISDPSIDFEVVFTIDWP